MGKTTEVDTDLANGLKTAKTKRCYFALVLKGSTDGALLVSKTKVAAPAIAAAKKKSGGSALLSGFVSFADGAYLFETAKSPPATAAQATKTIVKRDAELTIKAEFRLSTDSELLAEDGDSTTASSPTAPKDGATAPKTDGAAAKAQPTDATYQARVKALSDDLKKAIGSGTPAGNEAKLRFSESQVFSRKKDFAQALSTLDSVEALIETALAGATATSSTQASSGEKTVEPLAKKDSGPASAMQRLNDLKPAIKTALSAGGPNVARIQKLLASAAGLLKTNDPTQADKVLDELEPLLGLAKGSGATDSSIPDSNADELRERIKDIQIQAAKLPEPSKSELRNGASRALAAVGKTESAKLAVEIDGLENKLAMATRAARIVEAASEAGGRVSFRRLQFEWQEAQGRARDNLDQFGAKLLADKEVQGDPRFKDIQAAVSGFGNQLPDFGDALDSALGEIDDAGDDQTRAAAKSVAQRVIANYSATLDGVESLRKLQALSDKEYGGVSFFNELQQALGSLKAELEKAK